MVKLFFCGVLFALVFTLLLVCVILLNLFPGQNDRIFEFLSRKFIPCVCLLLFLVSVIGIMIPSVSAGFFDSLGFGSSSICSSSPDADPEAPPRMEASQNASQASSQEASSQEASSQEASSQEASSQEASSQEVSSQASSQEASQETDQETDQEEASQDSPQEDQQAVLADLLNRIFYEVRTIRSLLNAQAAETDFIGTAEASDEASDASELETGDSSGSDRNISLFSVPADSSDSGSDSDSSSGSAEADSSASAEDIPSDVTLLTIHTDIWLLLFTLWGFAGLFFAFKVGGVLLGRL